MEASIEPALVDQVLHDVRRDEAANGHARYEAAHLQYVLRRLWDEEAKRGSPVLRLATLEQLGGSKAIFERHFDEAVAGLGSAEQDALARAFRFLVTTAGTKRAESAADLAELAGVPQPTLERALEHLREARVLTPGRRGRPDPVRARSRPARRAGARVASRAREGARDARAQADGSRARPGRRAAGRPDRVGAARARRGRHGRPIARRRRRSSHALSTSFRSTPSAASRSPATRGS